MALRPVAGVSLAGNTPGVDDSVTILDDHADRIEALEAADTAFGSHGASNHTNLTRSFWMPAGAGAVTDNANLISGAAGPVYAYPNGATETVTVSFPVPGDWVSGLSYTVYWIPSTTENSAVRWSANYLYVTTASTDMSGAGTTAAFTGASQVHTSGLAYAEAAQTMATGEAASRILRFALSRVGANAADTFTGDAQLVGVSFSYTANQ